MIIADEAAMFAFGERFAHSLSIGDWVAIDGSLGVGKTVLCKGILRALGFAGEVASPSYAIIHQYEPPETSIAIAHADLYRLNDFGELDELGLAEERDQRLTLVEWAERAGTAFMRPTHHIVITMLPDGSRILRLTSEPHDNSN